MASQTFNQVTVSSPRRPPEIPKNQPPAPRHPKGSQARVLLTSVFGPYARDDEYGSRRIKPMELYHSQITRYQGVFSIRMSNRSYGLMLIQANVQAPCTLLDFPTLERFDQELRTGQYDVVGIGAIVPNLAKVQKMCSLVREHLPRATVLVGGYVATIPGVKERIDADYIVPGEGIRWLRRFLGEDAHRPIRHPPINSVFGCRSMGVALSEKPGDVAATIIPTLGCPKGCNFCSTSAMFGGKGHFIHFFEKGEDLFEAMCHSESALGARSFFVLDENFLLYRERALRLLDLMTTHHKPWSLYILSSADILKTYTMEQLVGLGISWLWIGLEGKKSRYEKLAGTDTRQLVDELQSHGIRVVCSSIIGLEEHTPNTIDEALAHAISHDIDFHQFMLYSAGPGTPLFTELREAGVLRSSEELDEADVHGQYRFNFKHPHIPEGQETEYLQRAFRRDFEVNGPSIVRMARTILRGWKRYKNHPDSRIRERYRWEARDLPFSFAAALWAARYWLRRNPVISAKTSLILKDIFREFGFKARLAAALGGPYVYLKMIGEEQRLRQGWTFEPPTFYEKNEAAQRMESSGYHSSRGM